MGCPGLLFEYEVPWLGLRRFRAEVAAGGLGEGIWARGGSRGVVRVTAGRLPEASDVIEVEAVCEDRPAVTKAEDGLGRVDRFDSCACYGEEDPAIRDGLWGGQGSWDAGVHVDCGGDGGQWSEAVGCCFLECDLVMCFEAVEQLVWTKAWIDSREVPEGAVVAAFIQW